MFGFLGFVPLAYGERRVVEVAGHSPAWKEGITHNLQSYLVCWCSRACCKARKKQARYPVKVSQCAAGSRIVKPDNI